MGFSGTGTEGLTDHGEAYGPRRSGIHEKLAPKTLLVLAVGAALSACMSHRSINDGNCSSTPTTAALPYTLDIDDNYISVNNEYTLKISKKPSLFCKKKIDNTDIYTLISDKYKMSISYEPHIGKEKLNEYLSDESGQPDMGDIILTIVFLKSGEDSLITVQTTEFSR
ncbi:hypothetical protein [Pleomorphomonas sp. PLEO]|uniref:hypothetical protein n=1 Tax=Pleomorphomonas sp. PLEO TaxID=3239306 RepID=UPI00351ED698